MLNVTPFRSCDHLCFIIKSKPTFPEFQINKTFIIFQVSQRISSNVNSSALCESQPLSSLPSPSRCLERHSKSCSCLRSNCSCSINSCHIMCHLSFVFIAFSSAPVQVFSQFKKTKPTIQGCGLAGWLAVMWFLYCLPPSIKSKFKCGSGLVHQLMHVHKVGISIATSKINSVAKWVLQKFS